MKCNKGRFNSIEVDIYNGLSTVELLGKHQFTEAELRQVIDHGTSNRPQHRRDLYGRLEDNNKRYNLQQKTAERKQRKQLEEIVPVRSHSELLAEKEELVEQLMEARMQAAFEQENASLDYDASRVAWDKAKENLRCAKERLAEAERSVQKAKSEEQVAQQKCDKSRSRKNTADKKFAEVEAQLNEERSKLEAMIPKKLVHFSSLTEITPESRNIYVSAYDFGCLPSELKGYVIPVHIEESVKLPNTDGFFELYELMDRPELDSLKAYAEAYYYLISHENMEVELICEDEHVRNFAAQQ